MNGKKRSSWQSILIFLLLFATCCLPNSFAASSHGKFLMYVGTYTSKDSKGIYAYRFDADSGQVSSLGLAAETENPSFIVIHPNGRYLYAVNEIQKYQGKDSGIVSAFAIDRDTGKLTLLNQVASRGADPCYVSFDKAGKYLLVANYTGGSVASFPVQNDGKVGEASSVVQHKGSSVNTERQEGPHAHSIDVSPDGKLAMIADLGLDEILVDRLDGKSGALTPADPPFTKIDAGSGPRHFKFHPNGKFAYLISELRNTVTSYSYDPKTRRLKHLDTASSLPKEFTGHSEAAEIQIHPSGKFLYASNRGYDSIAVFEVNPKDGKLTNLEIVPSGGKNPRYFTVDPSGTRLLVAGQDSGNIVLFKIDAETGRITQTEEQVKVDSPVCIQFLALD